ncbi:MAG: hypothetical protein CL709_07495, partial [Chloroflexi bacterium]|nr:hypothetical protein [Chloroflexota bacterium]
DGKIRERSEAHRLSQHLSRSWEHGLVFGRLAELGFSFDLENQLAGVEVIEQQVNLRGQPWKVSICCGESAEEIEMVEDPLDATDGAGVVAGLGAGEAG